MKERQKVISVVVLFIGFYMLVRYWGEVSPPTISGLAFMLLGARQLLDRE